MSGGRVAPALLVRVTIAGTDLPVFPTRMPSASASARPAVVIIMGSVSDWTVMSHSARTLDDLRLAYKVQIVSAHRTPELMFDFARTAQGKGFKVIIAGAGGAAHLPGMVASISALPVIGVPIPSTALDGLDSLLSIAQMPAHSPVATMAIGVPGARNAALMAASILAVAGDRAAATNLKKWRRKSAEAVLSSTVQLPDTSTG